MKNKARRTKHKTLTNKASKGRTLIKMLVMSFVLMSVIFLVSLVRKNTNQQTGAVPATTLSFAPTSSQTAPLQKNPGEQVVVDIMIEPGTNAVSFLTVFLQYDNGKLQYVPNSFQPNTAAFPVTNEGPVLNAGSFAVKVSIGSDPTKAVVAPVKVGSVTFTALDGTGTVPTTITYTAQTSALSIGANDSAVENVIATTEPAYVAISGISNNPTATNVPPSPTDTTLPTEQPTATTAPPPTGVGGAPTNTPKPTNQPSGGIPTKFKAKIIRLLEKRLEQYQKRLAKLKDRKKIPPGQLKHLEKDILAAIEKIKKVLADVKGSKKNKDVKKQVKKTLKDLLSEYKQLAKNLDSLHRGMDGVTNKKKRSGKNTAKAQKNLEKMKHHLKVAERLSEKTDAGIDTLVTDEQLLLALDAVEQNAKLIKNEFELANKEMQSASQEIRTK